MKKREQIAQINELLKHNPNTILHVKNKGWKVPFKVSDAKNIEEDFVDIPTEYGMRIKKEYKVTYQNGEWNRYNDPVFRIAKEK